MVTTVRMSLVVVVSLSIVSCGLFSGDFNEGKARAILEANPVTLQSEQVTLTQDQVNCGVGADLWDSPSQVSGNRRVARLMPQGEALNFSDDIAVSEPGYRLPYAQVRGSFMLQTDDVTSVRDAKEQGVKIVEVKAGIKLNHPCFMGPLPLMGVRKGSFNQDIPPSFEFSLRDDGWHVEKMIH